MYLQFFLIIRTVSLQSMLYLLYDNVILTTQREPFWLSAWLSPLPLIPGGGGKALGWCCGTSGGVCICNVASSFVAFILEVPLVFCYLAYLKVTDVQMEKEK